MTFTEMYEEVSHLGFDTEIDDLKNQFIDAMNRGFRQVTRIRPRMDSVAVDLTSVADGDTFAFDAKEAVKDDYGSLPMNPVRTEDGKLLHPSNYTFLNKNTILFLPHAKKVKYIVDYVRKSKKFSHNDFEDENDIDLDDDLCDALALLVAYYVLMEDEAEKATAYLSRYNEMIADIRRTQDTHTPNGYYNVNGW